MKKDCKTLDNLPFLRGQSFQKFSHDNVEDEINCLLWASDFQLNHLRMAHHCYLDGTFDAVPYNFVQALNILILDPNRGDGYV